MIKQLCGRFYAVGGHPDEIIPIHWSLYNYNAIFPDKLKADGWVTTEYRNPLDLGDPNDFLYFIISKDNYFLGRLKAICNALNSSISLDKYKGKKHGARKEAFLMVEKEWNDMMDEKFLEYGEFLCFE